MNPFARVLVRIVLPLLLTASTAAAQSDQMFIFTIYGGLFFPANRHFAQTYNVASDAIWGGGISLPVSEGLFLTLDQSFFNAHATTDPSTGAGIQLNERFTHFGLLLKQPIVQRLFFRLEGGPNYVTVKQTVTLPNTPDQTLEAEKKAGWFLGTGIEQLMPDGRASIFLDVIYDYRRSHAGVLEGDFGGVRAVVGAHLMLF